MANLEISGIDELNAALSRMANMPQSVKAEALTAMGNAAAKKIRDTGERMGVRDPESREHILDKIKVKKPSLTTAGGKTEVTFEGTRTRGKTKTRNAEIAFVNEYGRRGQNPRPFVGTALSEGAAEIVKPGADIIGDWQEKTFKD